MEKRYSVMGSFPSLVSFAIHRLDYFPPENLLAWEYSQFQSRLSILRKGQRQHAVVTSTVVIIRASRTMPQITARIGCSIRGTTMPAMTPGPVGIQILSKSRNRKRKANHKGEHLAEHRGIFNGGKDGQRAAALWTGGDIDGKDAFE